MATPGMWYFREYLLRSSSLHDLGNLRLGRGVYIILSGPLPGCQESGIYAGEIESRVKSNNLSVVHFLLRNANLVVEARTGESYILMFLGKFRMSSLMKDEPALP